MKTIIKTMVVPTLLSSLLLSSIAHADTEPTGEAISPQAYCRDIVFMGADVIMRARQLGRPMPELYDAFSTSEVLQQIVVLAYDSPRFNTQEYKDKAVQDFSNKLYMECLKEI